MSGKLVYNTSNMEAFVSEADIRAIDPEVRKAHDLFIKRTGSGKEFLGWVDLPEKTSESLFREIEETISFLNENSEIMVVIGIGGSYLGSRAIIDAVSPVSGKNKVVFSGYNISGTELENLIAVLKEKDFCVNVISKSGTTTEPAIAFRVIEALLIEKYGNNGAKDRVVCTTDAEKGALRDTALKKGYRRFVIPGDVGGRFSVLSPVGLFPAAMAGVNIRSLLEGARTQKSDMAGCGLRENPACRYAATRNMLWRKGKVVEVFSVFEGLLRNTGEWWRQLFGESEGKELKGIFPAVCSFSTDLHSIGQLIQEGNRNIFETFLMVRNEMSEIKVPSMQDDTDGLNYLAGMRLDDINRKAYEATAKAHSKGEVPNSTIFLDERSAFCMGQLFYFFETAVAISAYISGVNPFDQPGVEAYKKEMFFLLGKPGAV